MNKTDKNAKVTKPTQKINPPTTKVLPFDDGSKKRKVIK
jgi:hypothetical protein